jgi:putative DNA primase/helicase
MEDVNYRPLPQMNGEVLYNEKDEKTGEDKPKLPGYELKSSNKYFVVTGHHYPGTPLRIGTISRDVLDALTLSHKPLPKTKIGRGKTTATHREPPPLIGTPQATESAINTLPALQSAPLSLAPPWVHSSYQRVLTQSLEMVKNATAGTHHDVRYRAGRLMGGALQRAQNDGYIYDEIEVAHLIYNDSTIRQGEERKGINAVIDGIKDGRENPLPSDPIPHTDLGNAQRFLTAWGRSVRYITESKMWIHWNGRVWERLEGEGLVTQLAHRTARSISEGLAQIDNDEERKSVRKWGGVSEGSSRVDAMVNTARPYIEIPAGALDTHNDLLCVNNGIVNLKTGKLEPHNPNYYITKIIPIDYTPGAPAPHWGRFLHTVFEGNTELIQWIQRVMGYTLTGSTDEHCLFFVYGVGKNGKSIFFEVLRKLLVDHLKVTSIEALLHTEQTGGPTPYVADLQGARCAMASEMPQGKRFNESLLKTLTGGDTLTARRLFGQPFSFRPTHTLWVSGNYLPRVTGDDEGIWRRVRIIPFKNIIQNPRPATELLEEFQSELAGILAWVIEGSGLWYREGKLPDNPTVATATNEYRGQEDIITLFLSECCILKPSAQTLRASVYGAFQLWGIREGDKKTIEGITQRQLTEKLKRKGIERGGSGGMYYVGLGLLEYVRSEEEGK